MTVTAALISATKTQLAYLITHDGGAGDAVTIPNDAGVSPDLQTDATGGILKAMMRARVNGYGAFAAAALTQAQARALLQSNDPTSVFGTSNIMRARTWLTTTTGLANWSVDANVDGGGDPVLAVTKAATAAGTAILYIQAGHTMVQG